MNKFIEVHGDFINVSDIRKVKFLSEDVHLGLFTKGENEEILCDYVTFHFADIHTFEGDVISLNLDLYAPEDEEDVESWIGRSRARINQAMLQLTDILKPIRITEKEYETF